MSNRSGRSWINREQQGSRFWIPHLQSLVQCQAHCLLQTSSTTPGQTRDSNPNPPIGDFDCGGDLDISSLAAVGIWIRTRDSSHQTLSTSDIGMGHQQDTSSTPSQTRDSSPSDDQTLSTRIWSRSSANQGPVPTKVHPISNHPPTSTHHPPNTAVADGGDIISTGR